MHRGTLRRLDEAFNAFFRRVKSGKEPGFPRFKSANRFNSVEWNEYSGWDLYPTGKGTYGRLRIKGVGHVKVKLPKRRFGGGVPCKLVARRRATGWFATVVFKDVAVPEPKIGLGSVGVDRGVTVLAALADDLGDTEMIENPRHLNKAADNLALKQQALSRKKRGSNRRRKAVREVARAHEKVRDARKDRNHQLSRRLVDTYDTIVLEKLQIRNMTRRPKPVPNEDGGWDPNGAAAKAGLNKSILDAAWGQFAGMLSYKAVEAGSTIIYVNPRNTSRECYMCEHVAAGNRVGTVFECVSCGHTDHADLNAARNILWAGVRPAPTKRVA